MKKIDYKVSLSHLLKRKSLKTRFFNKWFYQVIQMGTQLSLNTFTTL